MNVVSPNPSETYLHRMNSGSKHQFTSKIYQALRRCQSLRPGYQLWRSPHLLRLDAARPRATESLAEQAPVEGRWNRRHRGTLCFLYLERNVFRWRQKVIYRVAAALFASWLWGLRPH